MKERIADIFQKSMAIKSFTHTAFERDIENFLMNYIGQIPYFQTHPELFGSYPIPEDSLGRSVNWALVRRDSDDTVILFHHHDTVDTEDFGSLKDLAFDNQALKEKLKEESIRQDVLADISSGDWQFGRGSCDMKAALALQLGVLEEYSSVSTGQANLLYLSVGDEEAYSQGMRAAVGLLYDLKERFDLNYILAIDSEPFESTSESEKVLHVGTVGKLMPLIVTQGLLSHMKEPLKGVNAISLLAKIVEKIDLNPLLSDAAYGEQSPLPSWSFMRDLKEQYDVSTVLRAAGYFSLLYLDKSPQDLLNLIDPETFESHLKALKEAGYYTLSPAEAYKALTENVLPENKKVVWLTFDDSLKDFYTQAYPILQKYQMKATNNVITGFVQAGREDILTLDEIKEMKKNGMSFEDHTVNHPDLSVSSADTQNSELQDSKEYLDHNLSQTTTTVAYPSGRYSETTLQLAEKLGYKMGLTTNNGLASLSDGLLSLNRVRVNPTTTAQSLLDEIAN